MDNNNFFTGILKTDNNSIPVEIHYASRFSIFIKFDNRQGVRDGKRFSSLSIDIDAGKYEYGSSRFILETSTNGINGRLVFINDVYNFDVLFKDKDFVNLERLSKNLNLILNHKERVRDDFKNYMSMLTYDLKVYKHFFDELDRTIDTEPASVKDLILQTVISTEGRKFMDFFADYLKKLEALISNFTREEHEIHGFYLRKQVWDIILCSEFMTRTNLKPRGYIGDSETMRMIYENDYRGESTFAKILYKYSLEHPGAQAVRNRRIMIPKLLKSIKDEFPSRSDGQFKFMSVACGPAYELQDIFSNEDDVKFFNCALLDQDDEAIQEASDNIKIIEKRIGYKINVRYLKDSVRTMIRTKDLPGIWGRFNYIYSMGLFDYLTPPVAKAVIEKMYTLLEPGGKLFVGNYHFNNRSRWFMEYWHDWVLYYRTEEEFMSLLKDTDAKDISIMFEDTGTQMFLTATKP